MIKWLASIAAILAAVAVLSLLPSSIPEFEEFEAGEARKQAFISYMAPLIAAENTRINSDRENALAWRSRVGELNFVERYRLQNLAEDYGLEDFDETDQENWSALLARVNTVPASLALAQAA